MVLMAVDETYSVQLYTRTFYVRNLMEGDLCDRSVRTLFNEALKIINSSKRKDEQEAARETLKLIRESQEKNWQIVYFVA